MKKIVKWITVIVILLAAGFAGGIFYTREQHSTTQTKTSTTNYTVKNIGQLDVTNVFYDKTVSQTEKGSLFGIKVGKESSLYIFHFKAQVYYDLDQATSRFDRKTNTLTVRLPAAQVKLLLKDPKYNLSYDYYQVHNSIFVKNSDDKGLKVEQRAAKDVEKDILAKKDVIASAQTNAKKILQQMFVKDHIKVKCIFS